MTMNLFDPTMPPSDKDKIAWAPRPKTLEGLRVGLVENTKYNSETLLKKVAERLAGQHQMTMVHLAHKQSAGHGVDEQDITKFKTEADFVVAGVGD